MATPKQGKLEDALSYYKQAEALDPSNINTRINTGTLYQQKGDYKTAITAYDSVLILNPDKVQANIYKAQSLAAFIKTLPDNLADILSRINHILDEEQENADERAGGVPHGYQVDENGEIVVDPIEAPKVRKVYKLYSQYQSIRQVAAVLKKPYSYVRDILDDYRYEDMKLPIIPDSIIKKTRMTRDINRKNRVT